MKRFFAIIVTYFPNHDDLEKLITCVASQLTHIQVVDNTTDESITASIENLCEKSNIDYSWMKNNIGVASAHNYGINAAIKNGAEYVLIFDQDSLPTENFVGNLVSTAENLNINDKPLSAVGANITNVRSYFTKLTPLGFKRIKCHNSNSDEVIPVDLLISSGSLIPITAIQQVGLMDETLFIDKVDTEWFLRAKENGLYAYGACGAKMSHSFGSDTYRVWLGKWRELGVYPSFRYYYIFRNSILLYKRYYKNWQWLLADICRLIGLILVFGIFTPPRTKNLSMMFKGVLDGFANKTGALKN